MLISFAIFLSEDCIPRKSVCHSRNCADFLDNFPSLNLSRSLAHWCRSGLGEIKITRLPRFDVLRWKINLSFVQNSKCRKILAWYVEEIQDLKDNSRTLARQRSHLCASPTRALVYQLILCCLARDGPIIPPLHSRKYVRTLENLGNNQRL